MIAPQEPEISAARELVEQELHDQGVDGAQRRHEERQAEDPKQRASVRLNELEGPSGVSPPSSPAGGGGHDLLGSVRVWDRDGDYLSKIGAHGCRGAERSARLDGPCTLANPWRFARSGGDPSTR